MEDLMINTHVKVFTLLASGARFHPLGFISHKVHVVSQCFHNDVLALGTTRYLCKLLRQGMPFPAGISPWARRVPPTREVLLAPGKPCTKGAVWPVYSLAASNQP
jgi:hypothetical protein